MKRALRFGSFELLPDQRLLLANSGEEVRLGTRALDLLLLLLERAGKLVTKEELIARAWPNTIVEEINLRVNIAALRRKLGDGQTGSRYIVNVVGRGYAFVAQVSESQSVHPSGSYAEIRRQHDLPSPLTRMVGRSIDESLLIRQLEEHRLVTIVGVGGVGKSTLALAVATRSLASYPHGAGFVDLSSASNRESLSMAFAAAVGVSVQAGDPVPSLLAFLKDKQILLVVDNCEHVLSAVGALLESLLKGAAHLRVLATSREPLGRSGEWLYRLAPLDTPDEGVEVAVNQIERYPAVELFIERAGTGHEYLQMTPSSAVVIGRICRRLDGIPLAIELAAARIGSMGLEELAARLEDQSFLMSSGRRSGAVRHQTLRATLDWSYALLPPSEQLTLRRLAIFKGPFTLDTAVGVVARQGLAEQDAVSAVLGLADKSMLTTDVSEATVRHRLLLTTQAYAYEKLRITVDAADVFRWHAEQTGRLLRQAESDRNSMNRNTWVSEYAYAIEDVRAAIEWALSPFGDVLLGATLTLEALPFGFQLALTEEFLDRTEHALARLSELPAKEPVIESRLKAGLAALIAQLGLTSEADRSATANAEASMRIGITKYQIGPLMTKAIFKIEAGDYGEALKTAQQLSAVARNSADPIAELVSHRVVAQTQHFAGNHSIARRFAERVLEHPARYVPLTYVATSIDQRVSMRIVLSRILWLEGFADQAVRVANESVEYATSDSPFALCQALALAACPIALWRGDPAARQLAEQLWHHASRYRLRNWQHYAECFRSVKYRGESQCYGTLDRADTENAAARSGLLADTLATIDPLAPPNTKNHGSANVEDSWCAAELLRAQAEGLLRDAAGTQDEAEALLLQSIAIADTQEALAWKLRATMSLARLRRSQDRSREARALLAPVYTRFSEGFGTADLQTARALMRDL